MKKFPFISVIIATFNSERTIDKCLKSLRAQNYPENKLQIIIADGGSEDKTKKISVGMTIIEIPKNKQNAEYNKAVGLKYAKGELVLFIDHDNILPHKNWLKNILQPLIKDKTTIASQPLRYHYSRQFSLLDRYVALFGVNDPVAYYLGKADRCDYIHQVLHSRGVEYIEFDKKDPTNIPTLGANGCLIRRKMLMKANVQPGKFFHIDVHVDLVKQGFTRYAFVNESIIHLTNSTVLDFLKRRILFIKLFYQNKSLKRRYSVFMKKDLGKLILFIIYAATFIKPLIDSMRGYRKIKDIAWFLHPVMCFSFLIIYGWMTIKYQISKIKKS